ncbi:MAG: protein kinase [Planctomycetaceae bacterium]
MSDDSPQVSHVPPENAPSVDPQSVEGIFVNALAMTSKEERTRFLDEVCGENVEQRQKVELLLRAYEDAGSFLEQPVSDIPAQLGKPSLSLDFLTPSDDPSLLGTLGPYEVYEILGHGGMGIVFRGRDPKLNRVVAIKVMSPALAINPNARRRFIREAQAAAAISHPHVVTIHAVDDDGQIPYLVMECVVGQSLQQKIDKVGSLRLTEILRISRQIAEGLAAAHKQGLIHRDIKPANILLENGVERVKITDFGLARAVDDVSMTRTGEIAGTPQFMSPEQARGERVDQRSDLFSLGCVMYAMCTGRSPFRATSYAASVHHVVNSPPRPIEEINPEIPDWLAAVVARLLSKNPDERPQTADEVAQQMEHFLSAVQSPTTTSPPIVIPPPIPLPVSSPTARSENTSQSGWARPTLTNDLSDAFKWVGLYGALLTLAVYIFWAMGPRVFDPVHQAYAGAYGTVVLAFAALIGWAGGRVRAIQWGSEAFVSLLFAAILSLLMPFTAILGVPLGLLAIWALYTQKGRTASLSESETATPSAQLPHRLLDFGVVVGTMLLTLCIALLVSPDMLVWPHNFVITGLISLVIVMLSLPVRGQLFQGRFWRDLTLAICAILLTGALLIIPNWVESREFGGVFISEWLWYVINLVLFGIPLLFGGWLVWHLLGEFAWKRNEENAAITTLIRGVAAVFILAGLSFVLMIGTFLLSKSESTGRLRIHVADGAAIGEVRIDGRPATDRQKVGNVYEFDHVPVGRRQITADIGNNRVFSKTIEIYPRINELDIPGPSPAIPAVGSEAMDGSSYGEMSGTGGDSMSAEMGMGGDFGGYTGMLPGMSSSGYPGMGPSGYSGMEFPGFGNPDPQDELLRYKTELQLQQSQRLQLLNQLGPDHPKIKEIDARISTLEKLIEEFIPAGPDKPEEDSLQQTLRDRVEDRLRSTKQQLAELIAKYGIDHPEVRKAEALIANLEQAMADMAIKDDVSESTGPKVVSSPFVVSSRGGRRGFLSISIDDPGMSVAVRRKSVFDGTLSAEEEVFTTVGNHRLGVMPGTYQILIQRRWIGWDRQLTELTVKETQTTDVQFSCDLTELSTIDASELQLTNGFKFYWNNVGYQFGEASNKTFAQHEYIALCQLLSAYDKGEEVSELNIAASNFPNELVRSDGDTGNARLVPLKAVELRIDIQTEHIGGRLVFPEEFGGERTFAELGTTTIRVPPGEYGWKIQDPYVGWSGAKPTPLTLSLDQPQTLIFKRDFRDHAVPMIAEGYVSSSPERHYVFHWGDETTQTQFMGRGSMSNSGTTFFFELEQATVIGRLLDGLADKKYELDEAELIEDLSRNGKPVEHLTQLFQSIGQPSRREFGNTFTPDSWLILPGSKEGMYRIRPWPKGLVSDEEHEQLFGPEVEMVEPEVENPKEDQPAEPTPSLESAS